MELWIPVTVTAALFQTWRTALQQKLRHTLSVNAAGFVRYLYALPTGVLLVAGSCAAAGAALPQPGPRFLLFCAVGGVLQIFGTNLLIMAFGRRNFAVGTAYAKTEAVQGAILAYLLLHEALSGLAVLGIVLGVAGVLVLSLAGQALRPGEALRAMLQPAALCGLGAGSAFALTGICIKEANRALGTGGGLETVVRQALFGLLVTNLLQTLMQGGYLALRERDQLRAALRRLAQLGLGRHAVGLRLGLLVHRLRAGAGGAGALAGPGRDGVHAAVLALLPEGDAAAGGCSGAAAGGGGGRADPGGPVASGAAPSYVVAVQQCKGSPAMNDFAANPWARHRAALARNWWALVIRGLIAVGFGVAAFLAPALTLDTLVMVFGAYALVDGVFAIIAALRALARQERWGPLLLEGVIGIAAGLAALLLPGLAIVVWISVMAAWAVLTGGLLLAAAFRLDTGDGNWMLGIGGLISIVWGVLLWSWPIASAVVLTIWLGAYALFFGIALIAFGLRLRRRYRGA